MGSEHVRAAFLHHTQSRFPRGELWLNADVLSACHLSDTIEACLDLCHRLEMDFISLPVGGSSLAGYQYRQFKVGDIQVAAKDDLFVFAVIDGPFQRQVNKNGLINALTNLASNDINTIAAIDEDAKTIGHLIGECIDHGANAVVIAEDVAYSTGMFISRSMFIDAIYKHYKPLTELIHHHRAFAVFHSCGDIAKIIPDIESAGFDGLSCESECIDIQLVKREQGAKLTLLTGISCDLLEAGLLSAEDESRFVDSITKLGHGGGLLLCSSSGLYSPRMLQNIRKLYSLADKIGQHS